MEKRVPLTNDQKETLLEFIKQHPQLQTGKFTRSFTVSTAHKLWCEAADILNAIPGAKKDWKGWRKVMKSLCFKCKSYICPYFYRHGKT